MTSILKEEKIHSSMQGLYQNV